MRSLIGGIFLTLALIGPRAAQSQELYTYIAHWTLPRAQFQATAEYDEKHSIPAYEKLVADGTIVHWGMDQPFVHNSRGRTHGAWFAATSLAGIDAAMTAFSRQNRFAPRTKRRVPKRLEVEISHDRSSAKGHVLSRISCQEALSVSNDSKRKRGRDLFEKNEVNPIRFELADESV